MAIALFKFTSPPPASVTRRVAFTQQPTWEELAAKISSIYSIPSDRVCVSYVDNDGDEVTLSTDEELQEYYKFAVPSSGIQGESPKPIRFLVRAQREPDKPLPETPFTSNYRNTFGGSTSSGMNFEPADDDWQKISSSFGLPPFGRNAPVDEELHAHVETVDSEVSMSKDPEERHEKGSSTGTESDYGVVQDKGKRKATIEEVPDVDDSLSHISIVEATTPTKLPIHVAAKQPSHVGSVDTFGARKAGATQSPKDTRPAPLPADKVDEILGGLEALSVNDTTGARDISGDAPDPPLPELEDIPPAPTNPSLVHDVATLLHSFSSVLTSHPELAEGLRNIVRNAATGTYWAAHRDAVARAAEEVRRSAEQSADEVRRAAEEAHRAAEEAAGRRVAEAIGSVMRTIGQFTGNSNAGAEAAASVPPAAPAAPSPPAPPAAAAVPPPPPPPVNIPPPPPRAPVWNNPIVPSWVPGPIPSFIPPPPPIIGAVPPPPPPPFFGTIPPPPPMGLFNVSRETSASTANEGAPESPVDVAGSKARLEAAKAAYKAEKDRYRKEREARRAAERSARRGRNVSGEGSHPVEDPKDDTMDDSNDEETKVATKDAEPKEPEVKVKVEEPSTPSLGSPSKPSSDETVTPIVQSAIPAVAKPEPPAMQERRTTTLNVNAGAHIPVSAARGPFPQLEAFSVSPRRHHTIHGPFYRPPAGPPPGMSYARPARAENPFMAMGRLRSVQNITRRLSDMGFTPAKFPTLPGKISARVRANTGDMTQSQEDTAVQELLEELLAHPASPVQPPTSGSGLHRSKTTTSMPGGFEQ